MQNLIEIEMVLVSIRGQSVVEGIIVIRFVVFCNLLYLPVFEEHSYMNRQLDSNCWSVL